MLSPTSPALAPRCLAALAALLCTLLGAPSAYAAVTAVEPASASTVTVEAPTGATVASATTASASVANSTVATGTALAASAPTGGLLATGDNFVGELGLGEIGNETNFWQAGRSMDWTQAAAGTAFGCGIQSPGTLWCWGSNWRGQLGTDQVPLSLQPLQVGSGSGWTKISAGGEHACALRTNATLWCWGANDAGQLGLGDMDDRSAPTRLAGNTWLAVTTGERFTCGLKADRSLWCWGANDRGQLGTARGMRTSPTLIRGIGGWASVSAGRVHACGTLTDSRLLCWGANDDGQLGVGDRTQRNMPTFVVGVDGWAKTSAGAHATCGLKTDGSLRCWGWGDLGTLGTGSGASSTSPADVAGQTGPWVDLQLTRHGACAKRADSTLWCWGYNAQGQLGTGDYAWHYTPTRITTPSTVGAIGGGPTSDHTFAISQDVTPVNACSDQPARKMFANIGDLADYVPAPGGDFEGTITDWELTNAAVVNENESLGYVPGERSLQLRGGGAQAVSPAFCINEQHPTFRYLVKADEQSARLKVALRFRPKNNPAYVLELESSTWVSEHHDWMVAEPSPLATIIATTYLKAGGTAQLVFSLPNGSASTVQIDTVQVDPYRRG